MSDLCRLTEYETFFGIPIEKAVRIVQEYNAESKTGKWVDREYCQVNEDAYEMAICSECGAEITICYYDNYCPNCGAKMSTDTT